MVEGKNPQEKNQVRGLQFFHLLVQKRYNSADQTKCKTNGLQIKSMELTRIYSYQQRSAIFKLNESR